MPLRKILPYLEFGLFLSKKFAFHMKNKIDRKIKIQISHSTYIYIEQKLDEYLFADSLSLDIMETFSWITICFLEKLFVTTQNKENFKNWLFSCAFTSESIVERLLSIQHFIQNGWMCNIFITTLKDRLQPHELAINKKWFINFFILFFFRMWSKRSSKSFIKSNFKTYNQLRISRTFKSFNDSLFIFWSFSKVEYFCCHFLVHF